MVLNGGAYAVLVWRMDALYRVPRGQRSLTDAGTQRALRVIMRRQVLIDQRSISPLQISCVRRSDVTNILYFSFPKTCFLKLLAPSSLPGPLAEL